MGIYDRDYVRQPSRGGGSFGGGGFGGGGPGAGGLMGKPSKFSINTWLIVINMGVFMIGAFSPDLDNALKQYGHFSTYLGFQRMEVWRLVTFQFLHVNMMHVLFNMIGLWVFGGMVESTLGRKKYAAFYLVCGVFGGLTYLLLNLLGQVLPNTLPGLLINDPTVALIGASAGVFGVTIGAAVLTPHTQVRLLFPPISMKLRTFAIGYVAFAAFVLLSGGKNAGGQAAHLGGAAAGWFFIRNSHLLLDFFDVVGDSRVSGPKPNAKRRAKKNASEAEVDRILDKVRNHSLGSLTEKEKKVLRQATESKRR